MISSQPFTPAYLIAARRTALGRVGGLHRNRRVEDLAAPVLTAALADAKIDPTRVGEVIVGNCAAGGNPARLIALTAGLPDSVPALTIDRLAGSGLDAILAAVRHIQSGEADVIVAGGAESLSTAPWRVARPRSVYQTPRFMGQDAPGPAESDPLWDGAEAMASRLALTRAAQDAFALKSHLRAEAAREARAFVGEIVPLRGNADEAKDQSSTGPSADELERLTPYLPPIGTLTPGNTSLPHDGAAFVVVVSEEVWTELGKPAALRLVAAATHGVPADDEAMAPMAAMQKLYGKLNGFDRSSIGPIELGEASAAQALAFSRLLDVDESRLNPAGGAVARGAPPGAAGAVLVVRLFTDLLRSAPTARRPRARFGAVAQGSGDGLGLAALFEAVSSADG